MTVARMRREMSSQEFQTWAVIWAMRRQRQELEEAKRR